MNKYILAFFRTKQYLKTSIEPNNVQPGARNESEAIIPVYNKYDEIWSVPHSETKSRQTMSELERKHFNYI